MKQAPQLRVGRVALSLTPVVIAARGVSFLTPVVIALLFGASWVTDAFFYALAFPALILVVSANAMGTVATPIMARIAAEAPERLASFIGGAVVVSATVATIIGLMLASSMSLVLADITQFEAEGLRLTRQMFFALVPFMASTGAVVLLRAACEIQGRFLPIALAPLLRGGLTLATLLSLVSWLDVVALPIAYTMGSFAELIWCLAILRQEGLRPVFTFRLDSRLRRALRDTLPLLAGEGMVALNLVVDKAFAGTLEPGMVSLLEYAERARLIPQTLLEGSLLPVAYATWAHLVARQDRGAYAQQLDQSLRWVAAWAAAPLAGLFISRHVLISLLFERGAFGPEDTIMAADAFGWYIPGLWTMMLGTLAMRAHVVEHRLRPVLVLGVLSVLLNIVLDAVLVGPMGISGLALGSSLVWTITAVLYLRGISPTLRISLDSKRWLEVLALALACALVAILVDQVWGSPTSLTDPVLWIAAVVCFALLGLGIRLTRPGR